ncbi:MAG: transcription antitermination factor NusB [Candidatus Uhrbacteria bacterium]|nr:transcription antitermination factor NusB [Candidatus Uhrbacteria bacterium]
MSHRYLSRTLAVQTLFEIDFQHVDDRAVDDVLRYNFQEFAPDFHDDGFTEELVRGVLKNREEIDSYIIKYATEWPLEQIGTIDRNILRLGIFEMIFHAQIPARVAINEAIEIAKAYGGAASSKFVNGVLGALYKDILPTIKEKEERLKEVQEEKKKKKDLLTNTKNKE